MSQINVDTLTKLYYTIGEVSKMFKVNASLLRFWEKEFGFEIAKKTKKGNRLFSKAEIEKINTIYQLVRIQGYTLEGAKNQMKKLKKGELINSSNELSLNRHDIIDKLNSIKIKLEQLKSR